MIYGGASWLAGAVLRPVARRSGGDLAARMALDPPGRADIWLHGASVGELASARVVIEALAREAEVQVTANSPTGCAMVEGWGLRSVLAPLDLPQALRRFLDAVQPRVAVTLENEIWPNRSRLLAARGVRQFVLGARISARSARRWARLPRVIGPVLSRLDGLSPQDLGSEERLLELGLPQAALLPRMQLKLLAPARVTPPPATESRARTVLAASTHEGEEGPVLDAFMAARKAVPGLRLILAPRHPGRADEVAALMAARGLSVARRSSGAGLEAPALLADTLGEMATWYDAAGICITGGSLVPRGGHTPWEPAGHECAILHGPHVSNFTEDYALLHAVDGAQTLASDPSATLIRLASDPGAQVAMGRAARRLLCARAGDAAPLVRRILREARAIAEDGSDTDMKKTKAQGRPT